MLLQRMRFMAMNLHYQKRSLSSLQQLRERREREEREEREERGERERRKELSWGKKENTQYQFQSERKKRKALSFQKENIFRTFQWERERERERKKERNGDIFEWGIERRERKEVKRERKENLFQWRKEKEKRIFSFWGNEKRKDLRFFSSHSFSIFKNKTEMDSQIEPMETEEKKINQGEEKEEKIEKGKEEEKEEKKEKEKEKEEEGEKEEIRIAVENLPKFWTPKVFNKTLEKNDISGFLKAKKIPKKTVAFITFPDIVSRDEAVKKIEKLQIKGQNVQVELNPRPPSHRKRRREQEEKGGLPQKRMKIADIVTPLHEMEYEDQLKKKSKEMLDIIAQIIPRTRQKSRYHMPKWLSDKVSVKEMCRFDGIIPTPTLGYRNKVQFAIASEEGKPVIGYTQGQQRLNNLVICDPRGCKNTPDEAICIRDIVQSVVEKSELPPYDLAGGKGFWRQLTVRSTSNPPEIMAVIQISPEGYTKEEIEREKTLLTETLSHLKEEALKREKESEKEEEEEKKREILARLESVVFQEFSGVSVAPDNLESEIRYGRDVIYETVLGLKFRVSANSFFQVNSVGACHLYQLIADWVKDCSQGKEVDVVDVCCGTGTIGLCLSKMARKVIGVEMCADAVQDAIFNAKLNKIENCEFLVGKAEHKMKSILSRYETRSYPKEEEEKGEKEGRERGGEVRLVGVVDPPRAGLHASVIQSIRNCDPIRHLVYVSCNQKSLVDNATDLCRGTSSHLPGKPFRPVAAVSVDLFPHTPHAELVMFFERVEHEDAPLSPPEIMPSVPSSAVFPAE